MEKQWEHDIFSWGQKARIIGYDRILTTKSGASESKTQRGADVGQSWPAKNAFL